MYENSENSTIRKKPITFKMAKGFLCGSASLVAQLPWWLSFPGGSAGRESACNLGDFGSIPGLGRSLGERNSYPLQYSALDYSMDYTVHGLQRVRYDCVTFTSLPI